MTYEYFETFFDRSNSYCSKCFLEISLCTESSDTMSGDLYSEAGDQKEGLFQKIWNTIKSMINMLKRTIQNAINTLTEKLQYGMLSKKSKADYDNFVRACQQNPQLANKQIKVKDWKRITSEYDKITKNINQMINDDHVSVDSLVLQANQMLSHVEGLSKAAVVSLSVGTALKLCKECPESGRKIQQALRTNGQLCQMIDDQLGSGYSKELDSKLKRMQKQTVGSKILTKIGLRQQKSIEDALAEMGNDISTLIYGSKSDRIKVGVNNKETVRTFAKIASKNNDAKEGMKDVVHTVRGKGGINDHQIVKQVRSFGEELMHPSTGVNNNTPRKNTSNPMQRVKGMLRR